MDSPDHAAVAAMGCRLAARGRQRSLWGLIVVVTVGYSTLYGCGSQVPVGKTEPDIAVAPVSPVSPVSPVNPSALPTVPGSGEPSGNFAVIVQHGQALYDRKDYDGAVAAFTEAIRISPGSAVAWDARGTAYAEGGHFEEALADYSKALELMPELAFGYYNRARVHHTLGEDDLALRDLETALEIVPEELGYRANGLRGLILLERGDFEDARQVLTDAIAFEPQKADSYFYRGKAAAAQKDFDSAISDFTTAIELYPGYASAYAGKGYAYLGQRNHDEVLRVLQKALSLSPDHAAANTYLMLEFLVSGNEGKAEEYALRAAKSFSDLPPSDQDTLRREIDECLKSYSADIPDLLTKAQPLLDLFPDSDHAQRQ